MKKIALFIGLLIVSLGMAQQNYEKGMRKAFLSWKEGNIAEAVNMFERISVAEPDNWLPFYYVAQINTIRSFGEKEEHTLKQQLDTAQEFLDIAKAISTRNPEILVQQAMLYTAWIAFDGATYGMSLSGKVASLYAEALQLAPENPRVVFSKAQWDMGTATYFGKDTAPYCADVARSLQLFATFEPPSEFHPNWGQERAEAILETCK